MAKNLGLLLLLLTVCAVTTFFNHSFAGPQNVKYLLPNVAKYGILSLGVAFVIIGGGIDLSIGSIVGLAGCLLPIFLVHHQLPIVVAIPLVLLLSAGVGLIHGLLVTQAKLQPFIVTLCGLLIYRGVTRYITGDSTQGFGSDFQSLKEFVKGTLPLVGGYVVPYTFLLFAALAAGAAVFLDLTVFGRYLFAMGRNEQAARYSGINTNFLTTLSYVVCSACAGLTGILFAIESNTVQPQSAGEAYELYAIAGAVLGGCSLRGGEGSVFGLAIGAALLTVLTSAIRFVGIPSQLEFATIGGVILLGVLTDETLKRIASVRSRKAELAAAVGKAA